MCGVPGPFGYNEEVDIRVDFSMPVTSSDADNRPALSVVVGSSSTAATLTYLTASAVYSEVNTSSGNDSVSGDNVANNSSSLYFTYIVGADDESDDLR